MCANTSHCLWQRFPQFLCVLAHSDEQVARRGAVEILVLFDKNPAPPPLGDAYTYALLKPGAAFRRQLELFISGVPRWVIVF